MFITFEGIEGSGKSTQIRLLAQTLRGGGRDVVVTREPGGTPIGDQIRKILLDAANTAMVPECESLLYWAARAQHVRELVRPALLKGKIVLCDRYVDSTYAYQGYARGLDFTVLTELKQIACGDLEPDKTLLFDLPVSEGLKRARRRIGKRKPDEREDRFENEVVAFHEKVRAGFLTMAAQEPKRFVTLDATLAISDLQSGVFDVVTRALDTGGQP